MTATVNPPTLQQQLAEIPVEYQDVFRQALTRELAELEQNRTDMDILNYLRQRQEDFKRGSFIRPDGRPGVIALSPEAMYEQALPQLAQNSLGLGDNAAERRRTIVKLVLFAGLVIFFIAMVMRGRSQLNAEATPGVTGTPPSTLAAPGTPLPTPTLPAITGADDSLQTIGGLGGALTIGRPSALELHYSRTEETIALAIDPSQTTPKGELRYNEATMLSDNPVAVWLFGTVLNYAIGVPEGMVRNLAVGDRLTLSTDTGAALHFVVARTWQGTNHETSRLLSQNQLGLTLFALPAAAAEEVWFAFAHYDSGAAEASAQTVYEVGKVFPLGGGAQGEIRAVQFEQTDSDIIRIAISGTYPTTLPSGQTVLLSLTTSQEQTTAIPLAPAQDGHWTTTFTLPLTWVGEPLWAEFRLMPEGNVVLVNLGEIPDLRAQLHIAMAPAWWDSERHEARLTVSVHNAGAGAVYLGPEFIQPPIEGGDAYKLILRQITPRLPLLINPGETLGFEVAFLPENASVRLQIGTDLWEIANFPETGHAPAGQ